ncbi:DUF7563 family protein [Halalkalicoccus subterraneus]|uniref:DUF7563 family protein n=1 Tax=Halalkalicoccus subterraneus TaxID=2675002 RepID=UPI001FE8CB19|nr:hypothetical protein [Halalkalicoccus subterraneus]
MVRCNRCDGYVSRDYARVFGDNHDQVSECPNCPISWQEEEADRSEESDRKLTFRMSEFELDESSEPDESSEERESVDSETTRANGPFGRVGRAVSGLF